MQTFHKTMKNMKKILFILLLLMLRSAFAGDAPLKVLMVGNSFSLSCKTYLPCVAASANCKLDLEIAYIGGCSLQRHIEEYIRSEKDKTYRPYTGINGDNASLQELLAKKKWDIISIQQASHFSWRRDSYQPWADQLIDIIRKSNPQAEIVVHETWSYNGGDRLAHLNDTWSVDQKTMFEMLDKNYRHLAKTNHFRIVPVGAAVQLSRKDNPRQLPICDAQYLATLVYPCELPETSDVVGRCSWEKSRWENDCFC